MLLHDPGENIYCGDGDADGGIDQRYSVSELVCYVMTIPLLRIERVQ